IFKGTVVDNATHQPLEYACVRADGKLCCSNRQGYFQISLPSDTTTLSITYIGYITKVLSAKKADGPITISMDHGQVDLKEVVIAPSLCGSAFHTLSTLDLRL